MTQFDLQQHTISSLNTLILDSVHTLDLKIQRILKDYDQVYQNGYRSHLAQLKREVQRMCNTIKDQQFQIEQLQDKSIIHNIRQQKNKVLTQNQKLRKEISGKSNQIKQLTAQNYELKEDLFSMKQRLKAFLSHSHHQDRTDPASFYPTQPVRNLPKLARLKNYQSLQTQRRSMQSQAQEQKKNRRYISFHSKASRQNHTLVLFEKCVRDYVSREGLDSLNNKDARVRILNNLLSSPQLKHLRLWKIK